VRVNRVKRMICFGSLLTLTLSTSRGEGTNIGR
jgi:hypothetical protein